MLKKILLISVLGFLSIVNALSVNNTIPDINIKDQFEKNHTISNETKVLLFASDKDTSEILRDYLLAKPKTFLKDNSALYIADISGMPSLIAKFFALPKMKKYPFSILLLDDTNKNYFDKEDGKIIVYFLDNKKVKNIQKISSKEELEKIFK